MAGIAGLLVAMAALFSGCGTEPVVMTSTMPTAATSTTAYQRHAPAYYKGINEPHPDDWQDLVSDSQNLIGDGFNTATLSPPVLIDQRAGRIPRVILEGQASSAMQATARLHDAGLAVQLAPTTKSPGLNPQVDNNDAVLQALSNDTLQWAQTAEDEQVELFSPLDDFNLVLGSAAGKWSSDIVPQIRQKYHGALAAKVVPDLGPPPPEGVAHDFEALDYKGYDYLMIDIFPQGTGFDQDAFTKYADDLMTRAQAVAQRDGLKGVLVNFGSWREAVSSEPLDGPGLGADGQAQASMASNLLARVMPRASGVFFNGWTLPGRGAKGYPVEGALCTAFGGQGVPGTGTTCTGTTTNSTSTVPGSGAAAGASAPGISSAAQQWSAAAAAASQSATGDTGGS